MSTLRTLLGSRQFGAGLVTGLVATALALVSAGVRAQWWRPPPGSPRRSSRPRPDRPPPPPRAVPGGLGLGFVAAAITAFAWAGAARGGGNVEPGTWIAVGLLWIAGELADHGGRDPRPTGAFLAVPGSILLAGAAAGPPVWAVLLLVAGPTVLGTAIADFDARHGRSGIPFLAFVIALGCMYATLPDTEFARCALGAALPLAILAWPTTLVRLGRGGSYAAVGLYLSIAVAEGAARPGSIIGAAAGLGMLVAEPIARAVVRPRAQPLPTVAPRTILGVQLALAWYCARIVGLRTSAAVAVVLALPASTVAALWAYRARPEPRPGVDPPEDVRG